MGLELKTTRPVRDVRTIEDIEAIEAHPYDDLVAGRNLYQLFLATAAQVGGRKALTVLRSEDPEDIGISLTHGELLREVTRAANLFRALGVEPGSGPVAFLVPTLPEMPALLFGAQVAGVASTINYLLSRDAVVDLLDAEGARVLVVPAAELDETCWSKAQGMLDAVPSLRHVLVIGKDGGVYEEIGPMLASQNPESLNFEPAGDRDVVCALFHTGGTTGRPKLVPLTHGNQIHAAFSFAQVFAYCEEDTVINGFPFFHVGGTMTVGLAPIAAGGHVVVPGPYGLRPPGVIANYWSIVEKVRPTVIGGVPTSLSAMANSWAPGTTVSQIRMAGTGGAVCPGAVSSRFTEVTGIRVFETYGMTETAAAIAFNPGRGEPVAGSVGFRAPYSQIRIVSLEPGALRLCATGESGIVQVCGPQVFPGYIDPAHNVGTLDEDGWLTTGDIGFLTEDQRLTLTGREKDLIVRSGHNIDPAAIEDVANNFESVDISAAVGMPDQYAGEVPALFVTPKRGASIDLAALRDFIARHVSEPPARPKNVYLIDALPVTAVGKIFKPALRDMAIEEKVRQEADRIFGFAPDLKISVSLDARKHTVVRIRVAGVDRARLEELSAALKPLPQTYEIEVEDD